MSDHVATFGDSDELWIVAERIISAQGVIALDRANRQITPPTYERTRYDGSVIGLDNGTTIQVPQSPREVFQRRHDAIMRQGMLPDG